MDSFERFLRRFNVWLSVIGAASLCTIMALITVNIILRTIGHSILGVYEVVELAIVPMIAFALAYTALKSGGHVAVDIVTSHLTLSVRRILAIIMTFLGLGYWALIAWQGAIAAWQKSLIPEETITIRWPVYPMRWVLVFGVIILCLVLFVTLVNLIRTRVGKGSEKKGGIQARDV